MSYDQPIRETMSNDRITVTKETTKDGKKSISYRKSWEKNGMNHSIEVSKVDGGYIIEEAKHGKPKDGGEDAEWIDERTQRVSTTNPFDDDKEDNLDDENMFSFVDKPTF